MKTRTLILVFLIMAVLIIAGSCATGKKAYEAKEDEELFGTWVNLEELRRAEETEYDDRGQARKIVFHPDGTLDFYWTSTSTRKGDGTFSIIEKWTDDEGNIWYKSIQKVPSLNMIAHALTKISNSGNTMESSFKTSGEFPTLLDPNDLRVSNYEIYYRQ